MEAWLFGLEREVRWVMGSVRYATSIFQGILSDAICREMESGGDFTRSVKNAGYFAAKERAEERGTPKRGKEQRGGGRVE